MRIIAYVNANSGPAYHRLIVPLMLMGGPDVYITNNLTVEDFEKGCDVFIYNRIMPDHAAAQIAELKQKYEFKTVVDIDDYWYLDPHHVLYSLYHDEDFATQQIRHLKDADAVLTTHERLAEMIRPINPNVHICPNAIPKTGQFNVKREQYHLTRLFWQGSITHRTDIEILTQPLEQLGKLSKYIKMILAGYTEGEPEWDSMARTFTANLKHQYKFIPGEQVTNYYKAYAHADICLIPLVRSAFNQHKSNLKVLEAANLALPVIASAVHPYLDLPINYCRKASDWVGHIRRLVQFPQRRIEEGLKLQSFCDEHFNFESINTERKQILEYVGSKQTIS